MFCCMVTACLNILFVFGSCHLCKRTWRLEDHALCDKIVVKRLFKNDFLALRYFVAKLYVGIAIDTLLYVQLAKCNLNTASIALFIVRVNRGPLLCECFCVIRLVSGQSLQFSRHVVGIPKLCDTISSACKKIYS